MERKKGVFGAVAVFCGNNCSRRIVCSVNERVNREPDWTKYRFVAMLQCDSAECAEPAVSNGEGGVEPGRSSYPDERFEDAFHPRFVYPSPDLFPIASECHQTVAAQIRRAFVSSWGDYDSCVNQIRIALELLLTDRGVAKYTRKNGRRSPLSLHARIEKLASSTSAKTKHLSDLMKAVKWLGNLGSHGFDNGHKKLSRSDVFDALDLLQYVLDEIYNEKSSNLAVSRKRSTAVRVHARDTNGEHERVYARSSSALEADHIIGAGETIVARIARCIQSTLPHPFHSIYTNPLG